MTQIKPTAGQTTPRFADIATFFRLPIVKDLNQLDYCICGIPWDGGTTNRPGARHGPREIRNASSLIRTYHPSSLKSPYDKFQIADIGDCPVNPADLQDSLNKVTNFYNSIVESNTIPLSIGGDHLVSLPILRALAKNKPVGMFQFDSHSDTWDTYFGGFKYTHGTPFRRAIEEGLLDPKRVVQIGIRGTAYNLDDIEWGEAQGVRIIRVEELFDRGIESVMEEAKSIVGKEPTYCSFDIDFIDPSYAPGTGTPEIGGPNTFEAQKSIRLMRGLNLVGADLVEVSPPFDASGGTAWVGASLMFELMCVLADAIDRRRN